jgi:hypothetical protein
MTIRVYRRSGEHFEDGCARETVRLAGRGVLVWGRIRLGGRAHSKIVVGTSVNAVRYRDGILLPTFVGMAPTTHTHRVTPDVMWPIFFRAPSQSSSSMACIISGFVSNRTPTG